MAQHLFGKESLLAIIKLMQHPFINDLSKKSLEELSKVISELNTKLNFAYRMQNGSLINQLNMAINSYNTEYKKRMDEMYKKNNLDNQINISSDRK
jgi:hypothetical protein